MIPISKPSIGPAEKQAVLEVLESGLLAQGPRTALLEERFAAVCGTRHAIATTSGTTALYVALVAHGIGPGDEVITTPFSFAATAHSIVHAGETPVFVDIDAESFNINPELVEAAVSPRTRALLLVHLYGNPCAMDRLLEIAERHGLAVIEDAAQAIGADYHGRSTGSFGTGCFSLYATKNIMSGEGGMITTDAEHIAERCRLLRSHGMQRRYYHELPGFNFRMTDLQAAIGLAQLGRLDELTARRRANADYYRSHISALPTPQARPGFGHVWHQYTLRVPGSGDGSARAAAARRLERAGIGTGIYYPLPLHKQESLRRVAKVVGRLQVAEQAANEVLSLPVHPELSEEELGCVAAEVNRL